MPPEIILPHDGWDGYPQPETHVLLAWWSPKTQFSLIAPVIKYQGRVTAWHLNLWYFCGEVGGRDCIRVGSSQKRRALVPEGEGCGARNVKITRVPIASILKRTLTTDK